MRFGALAAWTVSAGGQSTLLLTAPAASFLTSSRAARDGRFGSTLGGHYIAIPEAAGSSVGDHYFYFTQDDGAGSQRGLDPGGWDTGSLSGYTGHQVQLPFGISGVLSSTQVASHLQSAMTSTYSSVTVSGSQVTVVDTVSASATFFGSNWDSRGPGGIWGMRNETNFSNNFAQNDTTLSHMLTPNVSGTMYVRGMSVNIGNSYDGTDRLRLSIYQGGVSSTDPTSASLVHDFGQIPASALTNDWITLFATGTVALTSGSDTWLCLIAIGNGNTDVSYENSSSDFGDFTQGSNIFNANSSIGNDPSTGAPQTIPAGTTETAFGFVMAARLIYETDPIVGNGEWKRLFGTHVEDPLALTNTSVFSGTVMIGGSYPIQVSGSNVEYIEMAALNNPTFRMALIQGGDIEDPASATMVWDAGQMSGPAGSAWTRITNTGSNALDLGERLWLWTKGDGTNGTIRFDLGPDPGQANPDDNPYDWLANAGTGSRVEYETQGNPNHNEDATLAFESPFVSDPSDFFPDNIPGLRFGMSVAGFSGTVG